MTTEEFRILLVVDPSRAQAGIRGVGRELTGLEGAAGRLQTLFSRVFQAIGIGAGVRGLLQLAEAFQQTQNRIRQVIDSEEQLAGTSERLFQIANRTRQSYESTVEVFARLGSSSKELGLSQERLLRFTENLNKAVALSGASAAEASAGLVQFSQGIASGALRGDELRSVLEQLPAVADVIARGLGVTRGELRKLGSEGKLSAEAIIGAFEKAGDGLNERFAKALPTVGQQFVVLKNEILRYVGSVDQSVGVTRALAQILQQVTNHINVIIPALAALGVVLAVNLARVALGAVISQFRLFFALLNLSPIGRLIAIIGGVSAALLALGVDLEGLVVSLRESFNFDAIVLGAAAVVDTIIGYYVGAYQAIGAVWDLLPERFGAIGEAALGAIRDLTETTIDYVVASFQTIGDVVIRTGSLIKEVIANSAGALGAISAGNLEAAETFSDNAKNSARLIGQAFASLPESFRQNVAKLRDVELLPEVELSKEGAEVGAVVGNEFLRGFEESTAASDLATRFLGKFSATPGAPAPVKTDTAGEAAAAEQKRIAGLRKLRESVDDLIPSNAALIQKQEALNELFVEAERDSDLYQNATARLRIAGLESAIGLQDGFSRAFARIREEATNLAAVSERVFGVFVDSATDALIQLAETGEINFKDLSRAILKELTAIIARLLVVQAISLFGGGGAVTAGASLAGRAHGGPVHPGKDYVVGERGPEILRVGAAGGNITPNSSIGGGRPSVNVQIVNVDDPSLIPAAIAGGDVDEHIINLLARNKDRVKQVIA